MKRKSFSLLALLFPVVSFSQVAINKEGTPSTDTTAILEVKNPVLSKLRIRSTSYDDTARLELSNRNSANEGTDFSITAKNERGLYITSSSDLQENNNDSILVLRTDGRIGIGNKNPAYKLDVEGDINLTNYLRIKGNPGVAGQVLTATDIGSPEWKTTAFGDNIRFGFYLTRSGSGSIYTPLLFGSTSYNLSPSNINVSGSLESITINQPGLYHFEGYFYASVSGAFSWAPRLGLQLTWVDPLAVSTSANPLAFFQNMAPSYILNTWTFGNHFSADLYMAAQTEFSIKARFDTESNPSIPSAVNLWLYGYRISP